MQAAIQAFEARLTEVEQFIKFVRHMQKSKFIGSPELIKGDQQFVPMLKACVFILLYNVIESCVRSSFSAIYDDIKLGNTKFDGTTPELRKIWLIQQLDAHIAVTSANRDSYINAVSTIASHIASSAVLEFNPRALPISGNLDAQKIRELCNRHGVNLTVSRWAKGGIELDTIKTKRNALAHGHISFVECGREYGLDDLERMHKQTKHFLRGFLTSLSTYTKSLGFKAA